MDHLTINSLLSIIALSKKFVVNINVVILVGLSLLVPSPIFAADYFVSPSGSTSGNGSQTLPWDLQTALNHPTSVKPGDTIWLLHGTYGTGGTTLFQSKLVGTSQKPIIIRGFPHSRATVNGGIQVENPAAYNWFWGFEITNTSNERLSHVQNRSSGLNLHSNVGHKAINMIIHNTGHPGIGFWVGVGDGAELYGNILWGNGVYDTTTNEDEGTTDSPWIRGSATYMQNNSGVRFVTDNIAFRNFTVGLKSYGSEGGSNGFRFVGNISFDNGSDELYAGQRVNTINDLVMTDNVTFDEKRNDRVITAGYKGYVRNNKATIERNITISKASILEIAPWQQATVKNNTFITLSTIPLYRLYYRYVGLSGYTEKPDETIYDNNQYFAQSNIVSLNSTTTETYTTLPDPPYIRSDSVTTNTAVPFSEWQSLGKDIHSSFTIGLPTTNQIIVRPNKYEAGKAHIAVVNWQNKSQEQIDVSGVLTVGDLYEIRDVQNYFAIIQTGTYSGNPISVPLQLTAVGPLIGNVTHIENTHTSNRFNVFVLSVPAKILTYPNGTPNATLVLANTPTHPPSSPTPSQKLGDANMDNKVDGLDYIIWLRNYNQTTTNGPHDGDFNNNGKIDGVDYIIWINNYLM